MRCTALFALLLSVLPAFASASDGPAAAALDRLRSLAGRWEGQAEWKGARTGSYKMDAEYYVTGNGSAVVENLISEGVPSMTTVYHLDGSDLRLTHFCAAQNQPRLKASRIDEAQGAIDFALVDVTNLKAPDAPHVSGLELKFVDANHIVLTFLFKGGGRQSHERITLARAAATPRQG